MISGWGGYPKLKARVVTPKSIPDIKPQLEKYQTCIARGMGRSYGDSANSDNILQLTSCDHFISFNKNTGYSVLKRE